MGTQPRKTRGVFERPAGSGINKHSFCSWLAMAGVSLKENQTSAGHKTIAMAARYAHLRSNAAAPAFKRMAPRPVHDQGTARGDICSDCR
jgi:hypothetical protein